MKLSFAHLEIWRNRRAAPAGTALVLGLALLAPAAAAWGVAAGAGRVAEVTDRLELRLADGRLVRLAGLDLPDRRRGDPQTAAGAFALLGKRVVGQEVGLVSFAARPDRWGRLVADLSLAGASGEGQSAASTLILAGFARVRPEFETRGCVAERLAAETVARNAGLGLWNDPDYSILDAADVEELTERDGRFVLVEGVVRRVGVGRARLYLDFGGRGGFTVVVTRKSEAAFQSAGVPVTALAGEKIRVRGVLDDRFGPRLEIAEPLMIERLGRGETKEGIRPGG
jgi:endonuclease YncB( thermonuclease family)